MGCSETAYKVPVQDFGIREGFLQEVIYKRKFEESEEYVQ